MYSFEQLKEATANLKTIDQKGKPYVMVNERVLAFRKLEPMGSITTEILSLADGVIVMKATVCDEQGSVLGTGTACEVEGVGFVNKTSYIENCETSAVGRALAMCGIGITDGIASAEEVEIAKAKSNLASTSQRKTFTDMCNLLEVEPTEILSQVGWKQGERMTEEHHGKAMKILMELQNDRQ